MNTVYTNILTNSPSIALVKKKNKKSHSKKSVIDVKEITRESFEMVEWLAHYF